MNLLVFYVVSCQIFAVQQVVQSLSIFVVLKTIWSLLVEVLPLTNLPKPHMELNITNQATVVVAD